MTSLNLITDTVLSIFISTARADAQAAPQGPAASFSLFVPLIVIFVIFYFLMIRPQQKQQKIRQRMLSELKKGDLVVTIAGIHGKIGSITDRILTLEIADNLKIKIDREAVSRFQGMEASNLQENKS